MLELKLLLKASGQQPPYVLVGHSVGAMYALHFTTGLGYRFILAVRYMRFFAAENPTEVAAVRRCVFLHYQIVIFQKGPEH